MYINLLLGPRVFLSYKVPSVHLMAAVLLLAHLCRSDLLTP